MSDKIKMKSNRQVECFSLSDLGFFDLCYDEIDAQEEEPIVISEKKVIYRDIHTFVERVKSYKVVIKKTFHKNLGSCL